MRKFQKWGLVGVVSLISWNYEFSLGCVGSEATRLETSSKSIAMDAMNPLSWTVSTLAGSKEGYVDGDCSSSQFRSPSSFTIGPEGNLYIADRIGRSIRKIDMKARVVSTVARDGIEAPNSLVWSREGFFLVADRGSHQILKVNLNGDVSVFSGGGIGYVDGPKNVCKFNVPGSLCFGLDGAQCYVSDISNNRIRVLSSDGSVVTCAGSRGGWKDGKASEALFSGPWGLCMSSFGELFICDWGNNLIRMLNNQGYVTTIAGRDSTAGPHAAFNCPIALALTPQNDLIVADRNNHRLRFLQRPKDTPNNDTSHQWTVSTFAGSSPGSTDGSCVAEAKFTHPSAVAFTPSGQLLVSSGATIRIIQQGETSSPDTTKTELSTSLALLLEEGIFSDFTFVSHSGDSFMLHRSVLHSRCESLAQESTWKVLGQINVTKQAWTDFFDFLYVDRLPSLDKLFLEDKPPMAQRYFELHLIAILSNLTTLAQHCKEIVADLISQSEPSMTSLLSGLSSIGLQPHQESISIVIDPLMIAHQYNHASIVSAISSTLQGHYDLQDILLKYIGAHMKPAPQIISASGQKSIRPTGLIFQHLSRLCPISSLDLPVETSSQPTSSLASSSASKLIVPFDFSIRVDDVPIPCHKAILYARWPYFRGMMKAGLAEVNEGEAQFPGVNDDGLSPNAMRALVWYFYSNSPNMFNHETGLELLSCASRYRFSDLSTNFANPGFEDLLQHCAIPIHLTPNRENCISLFRLALRYGNDEMLKRTKITILANLPSIIADARMTKEFESLPMESRYQILKESYCKVLNLI